MLKAKCAVYLCIDKHIVIVMCKKIKATHYNSLSITEINTEGKTLILKLVPGDLIKPF